MSWLNDQIRARLKPYHDEAYELFSGLSDYEQCRIMSSCQMLVIASGWTSRDALTWVVMWENQWVRLHDMVWGRGERAVKPVVVK